MKALAQIVPIILAAAAAVPAIAEGAESVGTSPPAASRYYPLIGEWKGQGQLDQAGGDPVTLAIGLSCGKASAGWAVSCRMVAKSSEMTMVESDLMGVDAVTGKGHWYAITNTGEAHDHVTEWTDASTMQADYSWTQNGKKMHEHITMTLPGKDALTFRSIVTSDGKEVGVFSGKLRR